MKITVKFEGEEELKKTIKLLEKKAPEKLKEAVIKSAIYVEGEAKRTTAWKNVTGNLRAKITHEIKSSGSKHIGKVGTNVFYGKHLEFGTKKMSARPWLLPALLQSISTILGFFRDAAKGIKP